MAFLDKLNNIAKNVGDKANDTIEITKLNAKIVSEKAAITDLYKKLGEFYYEKHAQGEAVSPDAEELFAAVDASNKLIEEAKAQIESIKAESAPIIPVSAEPAAEAPQQGAVCPACGSINSADTKFCSQCGTKMEQSAPQAKFCPNCGTQAENGVKFCCQCGTKIE